MNKYIETAQIFKAFCDENRVKIIEMLCEREMCAAEILEQLDVTQPTLSHHMKTLCESGIVDCRKSGKWTYYRISADGCKAAMAYLEGLSDSVASMPQISLEQIAAKRTQDLLAPRGKSKAKKESTAERKAEKTAEEQERERRWSRDVDIVIL